MKCHSIFVVGVIILSCLMLSCSKEKHNEITGLPNFADENLYNNYQYCVNFHYQRNDDKSHNSGVEIWITDDITDTPSLRVNNNTITILEQGGGWYSSIDSYVLSPDSAYNYELSIGSQLFNGTVNMPSEVQAYFPDYEDDVDYEINWNLEHTPNVQKMWCYAFYPNDTMSEWFDQLSGTVRSYKISKQTLENASMFGADIFAINISKNTNNLLVYGSVSSAKELHIANKTGHGTITFSKRDIRYIRYMRDAKNLHIDKTIMSNFIH